MRHEDLTITTYVNNLQERTDRRDSVVQAFKEHPEFDLRIMPAIKRPRGATGLWESIIKIIEIAMNEDEDVIVICEDDHVFTPKYNKEEFFDSVFEAGKLGCQILYGGIGNYRNIVPITDRLFWIDWSWCAQFMVIYKPAFQIMLDAPFGENDVADEFLSNLFPNKMVMFPFISVQKEFGYSDVTESNNIPGTITKYFENTKERIQKVLELLERYNLK